jgi:hypothetical protein
MELFSEQEKNNTCSEAFPAQALEEAVQEAQLMSDFFRLAAQQPQDIPLQAPEGLTFLQQMRALVAIPLDIAPMKIFNRDRRSRSG